MSGGDSNLMMESSSDLGFRFLNDMIETLPALPVKWNNSNSEKCDLLSAKSPGNERRNIARMHSESGDDSSLMLENDSEFEFRLLNDMIKTSLARSVKWNNSNSERCDLLSAKSSGNERRNITQLHSECSGDSDILLDQIIKTSLNSNEAQTVKQDNSNNSNSAKCDLLSAKSSWNERRNIAPVHSWNERRNIAPIHSWNERRNIAPIHSWNERRNIAPIHSWNKRRNISPIHSWNKRRNISPIHSWNKRRNFTQIRSKSWNDKKCSVRRKAACVKCNRNITVGDPNFSQKLSDAVQRILSGRHSAFGDPEILEGGFLTESTSNLNEATLTDCNIVDVTASPRLSHRRKRKLREEVEGSFKRIKEQIMKQNELLQNQISVLGSFKEKLSGYTQIMENISNTLNTIADSVQS